VAGNTKKSPLQEIEKWNCGNPVAGRKAKKCMADKVLARRGYLS
jgi:hypothetical protein